jgi:hypothetical protein
MERNRPMAVHLIDAFLVGYVSQLFGDALHSIVTEEFDKLSYLAWPLLRPIQYDASKNFNIRFAVVEVTPFLALRFILAGLAVSLWGHCLVLMTSAGVLPSSVWFGRSWL